MFECDYLSLSLNYWV